MHLPMLTKPSVLGSWWVLGGHLGKFGKSSRLRLRRAQQRQIPLQLPLLSGKNHRIEPASMMWMEAVIVIQQTCTQVA
jgi:hypothetical protein